MDTEITAAAIESAAERIGPHVRRTPILDLGDPLDAGFRLSLKLDSMQPTGSFKVRGAFSALTAVAVPEEGVAAASGGNFGLAVAYAAARLALRATVFVPSTSPEEKIGRIAGHGAEVRVVPGYYRDALQECRRWASSSGAVEVHAFDQPEVVAGQGTCGREIMDQVPDATTILVAVGGGGLIGGIASWVRNAARVVAVEPELCPTLHAAREAGRPVEVEVGGVAASALGASRIGDIAWAANRWIAQSLLVPDGAILDSQRWLWETCRVLAEPAGSAPIAALLGGGYTPSPGEHVVALVSGANTGAL
ncbi:MAG TPA: threonine/serine dehydratase [Acidimicrobiia bacterium]